MTEMLTVNTSSPNFILIHLRDNYGGKTLTVDLSMSAQRALMWAEQAMVREQEAERLRAANPALADAWAGYQTMLNLVRGT